MPGKEAPRWVGKERKSPTPVSLQEASSKHVSNWRAREGESDLTLDLVGVLVITCN